MASVVLNVKHSVACVNAAIGLTARTKSLVMPGLGPGIHVFRAANKKDVDGRDEPGHDENRCENE
jgi:hypothetical protein